MNIRIEKNIFEMFPDFCRGVVIAHGINNYGEDDSLESELRELELKLRASKSMDDYKNHPQISPWREAFRKFDFNPNQYPPSIANLVKRTVNGGKLPFINKLVCLMNSNSLRHVVPSGGDDLGALSGDLCLGLAKGDERYIPIGQPNVQENPTPGEVIYFDRASKKVMCRAWCWRNSEETKISPNTSSAAINVDGLPPVSPDVVEAITAELANRIRIHCGGTTQVYFLSKGDPEIEVVL